MKKSDKDKVARDFTKDRSKIIRVAEWREDGLWIIILSNGGRNFCAYIGVPIDHPLAGHDYDDLPVDCHGGLTYGGAGDGEYRPEGYYWYGWDYAHSGDYSWWGDDSNYPHFVGQRDWTLGDVKNDSWGAIYSMSRLKKLSEKIYSEAKK